ncbi:MAG: hypothetical protein VX669_03905 [Planctomycetota bacterium]|nr:hypothetical protein [Planctomycetota bacterium]
MSGRSVSRVLHRISSGRVAPFLLVAASILIWAGPATAQRGGSRGGSRGGGGGDRGEQIRNFFSQMQSRGGNGGSSDDRREQMRAFFSRMQQQRDGGQGGSSRSRGGREGGGRQSGGREGGSRGGRSRGRADSNATKPKPVVRVTIDLPENYAAMDRDKDGQLGLYEWKLSAIQQFRTLDTNRDGFLTPRELTSSAVSEETTTASTDDAGDSKESSDDKKPETSASAGGTVAVSTTAGPKKDDRTVRIAQYTFKALDKDKDGKLSAEEWQKSSRTRSTFAKKKVKLKLPIDEAGFVAAFPPRD